ncbi:MAG TPA: lantibiotic dehydratase, partial [Actinomycetes bacterium]|nr:lantibiotic dehydratase [Actinomycetes bacterium]
GARALRFSAAELAGPAAKAFPAGRPGWAAARLHSPDLHLCAPSADALARGEFFAVLSELHAAWPTFDCAVFTWAHPDQAGLRRALAADLGPRVRPLYPVDWPRYTGRLAHTLDGPDDRQLGFTAAPGADPDRLLPITAVVVDEEGGALVARAPDGRRWPLLEMFAALVSTHAVDGFKLLAAAPHMPRITVDRLVVARETWRTTIGGTGLGEVTGEAPRYLAARRWRARLGLPERVFVKVGTETKPFYADLTSPLYVTSLCTVLRSARAAGEDVPVVVSEMLPTPEQAWLPDAAGRRYFSELRLQALDPLQSGAPGRPSSVAGGDDA